MCIEEWINTKVLNLQIDNHLNWKNHIDAVSLKLDWAYYTVGMIFHISNIDTVKEISCTCFHFVMKYGIQDSVLQS
jgi:hypothetical protein